MPVITIDQIREWCGDGNSLIDSPWTDGEWTYASDAHAIIRVPASATAQVPAGERRVLTVPAIWFDAAEWQPLGTPVERERVSEERDCPNSSSCRYCGCDGAACRTDCEVCHGRAFTVVDHVYYSICGLALDGKYVDRVIRHLGAGIEVGRSPHKTPSVVFRSGDVAVAAASTPRMWVRE